jgi:type III secretion system low calcium response chaperone LcrH/SycD
MPIQTSSIFEGVDLGNIEQVLRELDDFRKQIADGLLDELFQINDDEHYAVLRELVGEDFNKENFRQKVEVALQRMMRGGCTLKEAFGITSEGMEAFYFAAHSMFERRNYPAARRLFQLLLKLDPFEPRYYHALGSTQHKQKDFLGAAQNYMMAFSMSPVSNPELHYHCADCYLKMDDDISAIVSLGHCIEACDDRNGLHRQIKMRAATLREALIKSLQEKEQLKAQKQNEQNYAIKKAKLADAEISKTDQNL